MNKKTIKNLLKPTWKKIIIAFVLLLFIFLPFIYKSTFYYCVPRVGAYCDGGLQEFKLFSLLSVPISYLFSCVIIFIFSKLRKK